MVGGGRGEGVGWGAGSKYGGSIEEMSWGTLGKSIVESGSTYILQEQLRPGRPQRGRYLPFRLWTSRTSTWSGPNTLETSSEQEQSKARVHQARRRTHGVLPDCSVKTDDRTSATLHEVVPNNAI